MLYATIQSVDKFSETMANLNLIRISQQTINKVPGRLSTKHRWTLYKNTWQLFSFALVNFPAPHSRRMSCYILQLDWLASDWIMSVSVFVSVRWVGWLDLCVCVCNQLATIKSWQYCLCTIISKATRGKQVKLKVKGQTGRQFDVRSLCCAVSVLLIVFEQIPKFYNNVKPKNC